MSTNPAPVGDFLAPPLTPGGYLKRRRAAAGLSIADVAARLSTEPRVAEQARVAWIEFIEADIMPAAFNTIVSLRFVYSFDLVVLAQLAAIALGNPLDAPHLCRLCACSDDDACRDMPGVCSWAEDDLCSHCATVNAVASAA